MPKLDLAAIPETSRTGYPPPYDKDVAGRFYRRLAGPAGLTDFGVNLCRLEPGAWSSQRHWHSHEDEFVYVLEGRPTLITDEGEALLEPGMCAGFRAGTGNAHHLVNRTTQDVVYLEVGDRTAGDQGSYPDDDLQAVLGPDGRWHFTRKDGTPY